MKVIITRAKEDSESFLELLSKAGLESFVFPCLEFNAPSDDYKSLEDGIRKNHLYDWVFFLSKNAADVFFTRLFDIGGQLFSLSPHLKFAVIGSATAKFLENEVGFPVDFLPTQYNTECFVKEFLDKFADKNFLPGSDKQKILLVRAELDDNSLESEITATEQFELDTVLAYKTSVPDSSELTELKKILDAKERVCISFASSGTVKNFKTLLAGYDLKKVSDLRLISIGPKTSASIRSEFTELDLDRILLETKNASFESIVEYLNKEMTAC